MEKIRTEALLLQTEKSLLFQLNLQYEAVQNRLLAVLYIFLSIQPILKHPTSPVSYTHLDVYKRQGSYINLEKSMTMNSKLEGHIVSGHVDTIGLVDKVIENEDSWEFFIKFSNKFSDNVIYKGSIALNGVSLTVAEIVKEGNKNTTIRISIIPHTFNHTNFKFLREGDIINIEFDLLGKYVKRILRN